MSQHDMNIENADGATFRADVNSALVALIQNSSGATEPDAKYPFQFWVDTSSATPILKIRNSANSGWITLGNIEDNLGLILKSFITSKGSLITGTATSTPVSLAVGDDLSFLIADSNQSTGLRWTALLPPTVQRFTATGSGTYYLSYQFKVSSGNATVGATYTNNSQTFTVKETISSGTLLWCTGTGAPSASGTLTKSSGTGDATITFSAQRKPICLVVEALGAGGGGSGGGAASYGTGGDGGNTTFGTILTAYGGAGGPLAFANSYGGAGGTISTTARILRAVMGGYGGNGGLSSSGGLAYSEGGGAGGVSFFGGSGPGSQYAGSGASGQANSGSGGGGGAPGSDTGTHYAGCGGGAGGYASILIPNPSSTYSYSIGAGGGAGTIGTGANAGYGGAGGSGVISIEERYQ